MVIGNDDKKLKHIKFLVNQARDESRGYYHPEIGPLVNKYTMRNPKISAENMHRLQRTLSDYLASSWAGVWQVADVHGGGSPAMETIAILNNYDFDERKKIIKRLAGIED